MMMKEKTIGNRNRSRRCVLSWTFTADTQLEASCVTRYSTSSPISTPVWLVTDLVRSGMNRKPLSLLGGALERRSGRVSGVRSGPEERLRRDGVHPAVTPRVAPQYPPCGEHAAADHPVLAYGPDRVLRAGRVVATARADER